MDGSGDAVEEASCGSGEFRRRTPSGSSARTEQPVEDDPSERVRQAKAQREERRHGRSYEDDGRPTPAVCTWSES